MDLTKDSERILAKIHADLAEKVTPVEYSENLRRMMPPEATDEEIHQKYL